MNNFKYRLTSPKVIEKIPSIEIINKNDIVVRPEYLSICAADQRYYFGLRNPEILRKKLPLSLIHECTGTVINNNNNNDFNIGDKVILYPNIIHNHHDLENYDDQAKFMSSTTDGFMQEIVIIDKSNLIEINSNFKDYKIMVLCELLSVVIHAIDTIDEKIIKANTISLWGDGNLSYLCHLYLIHKYHDKDIYIFGKSDDKLSIFSSKAQKINILKSDVNIKYDLAIEMVGGYKSEEVISRIISSINPNGTILLLGVTENKINIETRMVLEKGLTLIGRSRSPKSSFIKARDFIYENYKIISKIISEIVEVRNIDDINESFTKSLNNKYKTIMKWEV